jgi:hypothetical protein
VQPPAGAALVIGPGRGTVEAEDPAGRPGHGGGGQQQDAGQTAGVDRDGECAEPGQHWCGQQGCAPGAAPMTTPALAGSDTWVASISRTLHPASPMTANPAAGRLLAALRAHAVGRRS